MSEKVTFAESIEVKNLTVARFLRSKDFVPGDPGGQEGWDPTQGVGSTGIGIFIPVPDKTVTILGGLFSLSRRQLRRHIASIWNNRQPTKPEGTTKRWLLEVYGRENLPCIKDLAEELASEFNVEIHVRLQTEKEQKEWRPSD